MMQKARLIKDLNTGQVIIQSGEIFTKSGGCYIFDKNKYLTMISDFVESTPGFFELYIE